MKWFKLFIFLAIMVLGIFMRGCSEDLPSLPTPPPIDHFLSLKMISIAPIISASTGGVIVTIKGDGFAPSTDVYFNEVKSEFVEILSETEMRVLVPINLGAAGFVPVKIVTHTDYGHLSVENSTLFSYYLSELNFGNFTPLLTLDMNSQIDSIDLFHNGMTTILVSSTNSMNQGEVYGYNFNKSTNEFEKILLIQTPAMIFSLFHGDLNQDELPDIVLSTIKGDVFIYLNEGFKGFFLTKTFSYGMVNVYPSLITDFDKDGYNDIALIVDNNIVILKNNQSHQFMSLKAVVGGTYPQTLVPIDYDFDGYVDLLDIDNKSPVNFLKSNHDGSFQSAIPLFLGVNSVFNLFIADLNGDKKTDLGILSGTTNTQVWGIFNTDSKFASPIPLANVKGWASSTSLDINLDGNIDLIFASFMQLTDQVYISLGDGKGNYGTPKAYQTLSGSTVWNYIDFNHDHKIDFLIYYYDPSSMSPALGIFFNQSL